MRQRTRKGTSKNRGGARKGGKERRRPFARRAEELAAAIGIMVRRRIGQRPLKTEVGGLTRTRSTSANTRAMRAYKITIKNGRRIGRGRKRVRPG
jgi:hypothetical protein